MRDLMKTACLRARQLEIATYLYSLVRGLRPVYHAKEDSQSRVRRSSSVWERCCLVRATGVELQEIPQINYNL